MARIADTTKTILGIVISVLVIGGAITAWATTRTIKAQVDSTQDGRIEVVEKDVKAIERRVDGIDLKAAEELATKKAIFDTLIRMETAQTAMTTSVGAMKVDVATTKIQVATTKIQVENLERKEQ